MRLRVSATGRPGTTAGWPARTAATTRSNTPGGVRGRAASWTSTMSAVRTAAMPARTESDRCAPPATTTASGTSRRAVSINSAGTTTTTVSATPASSTPATQTSRIVRAPSSTKALGTGSPSLVPDPAAGMMTPTLTTSPRHTERAAMARPPRFRSSPECIRRRNEGQGDEPRQPRSQPRTRLRTPRPGPRQGCWWPWRRRCSAPATVRRPAPDERGSACASRPRTAHDPVRDATGRGRSRRP